MQKNTSHNNLETMLPVFFQSYQACRAPVAVTKTQSNIKIIDCKKLADWFHLIKTPLIEARQGAFQCDPWEVAGLGRNEVRNSMVLAWLLNPRGSHGLGDVVLNQLLTKINIRFSGDFPRLPGEYCNVRVETNPDGGVSNRVDIEIDCQNFYLVIEIKIDAPEGDKQLERYGNLAAVQAGNRPWAILFLTSSGLDAKSAGDHLAKVLPTSWRNLAHLVSQSIRHMSQENSDKKGVQRLVAEQIVKKFLQRMRKF